MANPSLLHLLTISTLILSALLISPLVFVDAGIDRRYDFIWPSPMKQGCTGSIAECMIGGEFEMDSESNRRILATTRYISYGALQANNVPCSRRGASYYNCRSGGQANPYQRGCSVITRCMR